MTIKVTETGSQILWMSSPAVLQEVFWRGTVTIDSYGNTEGWCEFGFGAGIESCQDTCWACELQDDGTAWSNSAAAQSACENSPAAGGECEFISFGSQDPSGRFGYCDFPSEMDFRWRKCK